MSTESQLDPAVICARFVWALEQFVQSIPCIVGVPDSPCSETRAATLDFTHVLELSATLPDSLQARLRPTLGALADAGWVRNAGIARFDEFAERVTAAVGDYCDSIGQAAELESALRAVGVVFTPDGRQEVFDAIADGSDPADATGRLDDYLATAPTAVADDPELEVTVRTLALAVLKQMNDPAHRDTEPGIDLRGAAAFDDELATARARTAGSEAADNNGSPLVSAWYRSVAYGSSILCAIAVVLAVVGWNEAMVQASAAERAIADAAKPITAIAYKDHEVIEKWTGYAGMFKVAEYMIEVRR